MAPKRYRPRTDEVRRQDRESKARCRRLRRERGLCRECSTPSASNYCPKCQKRRRPLRRRAQRVRRKKLIEQGRCALCGHGPLATKLFCDRCATRLRLRTRARNAERRAEGKCIRCSAPVSPRSRSYCPSHLEMHRVAAAAAFARRPTY